MSLIEVLMSLFILSCLLLGVNAMQVLSLREAKSAYYFDAAMQQVYVINERLSIIKNGSRDQTLATWNEQNQQLLPQGYGRVQGQYPSFDISIFWGNTSHAATCEEDKIGLSGCLALRISDNREV